MGRFVLARFVVHVYREPEHVRAVAILIATLWRAFITSAYHTTLPVGLSFPYHLTQDKSDRETAVETQRMDTIDMLSGQRLLRIDLLLASAKAFIDLYLNAQLLNSGKCIGERPLLGNEVVRILEDVRCLQSTLT